MDLLILAVGRCREPSVNALVDEYLRRCRPWPARLREVAAPAKAPPAGPARAEAEAAALLGAVPDGAAVVALDGRGRDLTSEGFAAMLGGWRDGGGRAAAFLIGGADGLAPSAAAGAAFTLALGRMTWPHQLVRVMLAEQLYRATTILAGHPYHRA